jgi:hypothetical protein
MEKFRVSVHGKNFLFHTVKRNMLLYRKYQTELVGFYTTHFVEAETANDAIADVLEILRKELREETA